MPTNTEHLQDMVDNIAAERTEQAQINFHEYMRDKVRDELGLGDDTTTTAED